MTASGIYQVFVRRGPAAEAAVEFGGGKAAEPAVERKAGRAHLGVDGLIYTSSMVLLDSARRKLQSLLWRGDCSALASRRPSRRTLPTAWAMAVASQWMKPLS